MDHMHTEEVQPGGEGSEVLESNDGAEDPAGTDLPRCGTL